ncbi:glycoside hydrolase family 172 protein [Draconibacterium sediminis]|uniref:DUF2961 domain-containing protein n=1 Tax=Draconibacterium sediminis TaxID=1544798 RepID=A0A0D8JEP9_9BACT|nr:glycoside hydrolase family 172 protein [Draconibacterium sediminis]KJF45385.1 hypothetical protein LH29_08450 [Draconibacterium sediminis]
MRRSFLIIYSFVFVIFIGQACIRKPGEKIVTIDLLLKEMTDRDGLAKLPQNNFKLKQASSYSRKSIAPDEEGWFDNADASQYVRTDTIGGRIEHVLMDVDGPGAIVRFWSTWHAQQFSMGTLRFYFDNSPIPQIEGQISDIISANKYVGAPLSQTTSPFLENGGWFSGHNLYFPLPYAKHCKVTYQKADESINDVLYYQINYRKYEPGTLVESYTKGDWDSGKFSEIIAEVSNKLRHNEPQINQSVVTQLKGVMKPGASLSASIEGEQAIKKVVVKLEAEQVEQALRSTVISMEFDGKPTVWVPVGDLFGIGYKISPSKSWLSTVEENGEMSLFFPMPFQQSAKITIHNFGKVDVELVMLEMHYEAWNWDGQSLYFHANWRNYPDFNTSEKRDVNYVSISGKGKYVGDVLTLFNDSYDWWGEGDEKIYVDGESFPSTFGTGTEDYYGYAWCSVVDFSLPFIAQPSGDGNRSPGLTVNSRWRSLDVIPFEQSLKFDMEIWHWGNTQIDYSPTTFWYGTKDARVEVMEDVDGVKIPVKFPERFEGEGFKVSRITGGEVITQAFLSYNWSARNHLLWQGIKKGDELEVYFYSEKERKGQLKAVFTQAPDYATADVLLNGDLIFKDLDLYNSELGLKELFFKNGRIKKGKNIVKLIVKDANGAGESPNKFGLDYILVLADRIFNN